MSHVIVESDGQKWILRKPEVGETIIWNHLVHVVKRISGSGWSGTTTFECGHAVADSVFRMEDTPNVPSCLGCVAGITR